jgi:hypothetical protein
VTHLHRGKPLRRAHIILVRSMVQVHGKNVHTLIAWKNLVLPSRKVRLYWTAPIPPKPVDPALEPGGCTSGRAPAQNLRHGPGTRHKRTQPSV